MYTHNKDGELGTMKRKLLDHMQITDRKVATEAKEVEMIHTSEERSHTPKESGRMNMGFIFPNDKTQAESAYDEIGEWPDYTNLKITPGTPKWNVVGEFFGICRGNTRDLNNRQEQSEPPVLIVGHLYWERCYGKNVEHGGEDSPPKTFTLDCNLLLADVRMAVERLRTEPEVYEQWAKACKNRVAWAIKFAKAHRLEFMFNCGNGRDSPYDWLIHTPTPQPQ